MKIVMFALLLAGCTGTGTVTLESQVVEQLCPNDRCGHDGDKSAICHLPPGNPENAQDLCIADSAVAAHFEEHEGDSCGACPPVEQEPDAGTDDPGCEETKEGCPPECGDQSCNGEETCSSCPGDCGECPSTSCGDESCDRDENCESCPLDCGECEGPPVECTDPNGCNLPT